MTDAILNFFYSDGVHLVSLYKRADCYDLPSDFKSILEKIDREELHQEGKLNFGFWVSRVIYGILQDRHDNTSVKMCTHPREDDSSFIFNIDIIPTEDYTNLKIPIPDSVKIKVVYQSNKALIFEGLLSEFIKLENI